LKNIKVLIHTNTADDLYKKISSRAQDAAKKYVRFVIRGKLGRNVPVLLNYSLVECIKLILKFRDNAKIPTGNPYVFGLPSYDLKRFKYLRACILMRKFSEVCNAQVAHLLRGTKLRKHIATFCAGMELADTEVTDLANFMGHAEKIHREIYRQPIISRDILNITQHLEAAQGCDSSDTEKNSIEEYNNDEDKNEETTMNEGATYQFINYNVNFMLVTHIGLLLYLDKLTVNIFHTLIILIAVKVLLLMYACYIYQCNMYSNYRNKC